MGGCISEAGKLVTVLQWLEDRDSESVLKGV